VLSECPYKSTVTYFSSKRLPTTNKPATDGPTNRITGVHPATLSGYLGYRNDSCGRILIGYQTLVQIDREPLNLMLSFN
jgi:hypothetical protein